VGQDAGGVGGDVVEDEIRLVVLVEVDELRQRLDRVGEKGFEVVDQLRAPRVRVVVGGQRRVPDLGLGSGLGDLLGELRRDRVRHAVPAGDELPDHLDARVHVPVGGDGEHGDMGVPGDVHGATVSETRRLVQLI
jgi:hypothetical protein